MSAIVIDSEVLKSIQDRMTATVAALAAMAAAAVGLPDPGTPGGPVVTPPAAERPSLGVYPGAAAANETAFEVLIGRQVEMIAVHAGRNGLADWGAQSKTSGGFSWQPAALDVKNNNAAEKWSYPLLPDSSGLAYNAALASNATFLQGHRFAAQNVLAASPAGDAPIYIRLGEEMNANWMGWAGVKAQGGAATFIAVYRAAWGVWKGVSSRFRFVWCPILGFGAYEALWPGNDAVDVCGFDAYCNVTDGQSFEVLKVELDRYAAFAKAHNKPLACDEWGVINDTLDKVAFVTKFLAWCTANGLLYQIYFHSHPDYTLANKPKALAAYKAAIAA
jgi:hypothetical protein